MPTLDVGELLDRIQALEDIDLQRQHDLSKLTKAYNACTSETDALRRCIEMQCNLNHELARNITVLLEQVSTLRRELHGTDSLAYEGAAR